MEEKEKEMSQEERDNLIKFLQVRRDNLLRVVVSGRARSIGRAIKRNRISPYGMLAPSRPFNNRANTSTRKGVHSRVVNEFKKKLYARINRNSTAEPLQ